LRRCEAEARARWPLEETLIIRRHGRLEPGDSIVLVAAASAHRDAAFQACRFMIDRLKTQAALWKREERPHGAGWLTSGGGDDSAAARRGRSDT
jgi:molybdopterin synthase catalytic subunit